MSAPPVSSSKDAFSEVICEFASHPAGVQLLARSISIYARPLSLLAHFVRGRAPHASE
jgi:hypothetical protein